MRNKDKLLGCLHRKGDTFIVGLKIGPSANVNASIQVPKLYFHVISMDDVFLGSDVNAHNGW